MVSNSDSKKETSPRISVVKNPQTSGSGNSGNETSSKTRTRTRTRPVPVLTSSSSENELNTTSNGAKNKQQNYHQKTRSLRRNSRDNLLLADRDKFRSSTNPRSSSAKNENKKQTNSVVKSSTTTHQLAKNKTKHKSTESILDATSENNLPRFQQMCKENLSENELLNDNFDFTSARLKLRNQQINKQSGGGPFDFLLNKKSNSTSATSKNDNNKQTNSVKSTQFFTQPLSHHKQEDNSKNKISSNESSADTNKHEPFGSTEFPTMKRNLKMSVVTQPLSHSVMQPHPLLPAAPPPAGTNTTGTGNELENEYESMTSLDRSIDPQQIRPSVWSPPPELDDDRNNHATCLASTKIIDGLSSPSVITSAQDEGTTLPATITDVNTAKTIPENENNKNVENHAAIEPPPKFAGNNLSISSSSEQQPPPLPVKKFSKHRSSQQSSHHHHSSKSTKPEQHIQQQSQPSADLVIQPNQVRLASLQAARERKTSHERHLEQRASEQRQQQQRNKRIRNRSLEMVLDSEPRSSDSSPSRQRSVNS